jgi:hypothetical protein
MLPVLPPSVGLGRIEVASVLGRGARVVLKLEVTAGGVKAEPVGLTGVAIGVGSAVLLAAGVVIAPAAALEEAGATTTVELAGAAALEEEGLEAPPPVAGEPEILPKVRSWGVASVPEAISSGPGMGYESRLAWMEKPRPGPVFV